uniref:Uncharacterized protein n=1 Tax=Zea mays TaxID=4577 RepID=B6U3G2_MAIZE|nr:hypothetical protein [Zea mays]
MHRGGDRSGGPSSGGDRSGARFQRGPSRWSGSSGGGLGGSPPNRYSSRGRWRWWRGRWREVPPLPWFFRLF